MALQCVELPDETVHEFRDLVHEERQTVQAPAVQHDGPSHRRVAVLHKHNLPGVSVMVVVVVVVIFTLSRSFLRSNGPPVCTLPSVRMRLKMIPRVGVSSRGLRGHRLGLLMIGTQITSTILQRFQSSRAGGASEGCCRAVAMRESGLERRVVREGVKALKALLVGSHFNFIQRPVADVR